MDTSDLSPSSKNSRIALVVGPDFYGYNESVARSLRKEGFLVNIINTPTFNPPGFINRVKIDLGGRFGVTKYRDKWKLAFNTELLEKSNSSPLDLLLLIKGDWINPVTFNDISARRKVIWFQDSVVRCGENWLKLSKTADSVFVFEGTDIDHLIHNNVCESKVHFLPMAFDEKIYRKVPKKKDIDVLFVGRMYPNREKVFERLIQDLPEINFEIWGRYFRYQEPRTWVKWIFRKSIKRKGSCFKNKDIRPEVVNELYNRSKIVVNIHHEQSSWGCNPRVFEIMGSGAFQICDSNGFVESEVSRDIVQFTSYADLLRKIKRYVYQDDERERVASMTHQASTDHSFDIRIRKLLGLTYSE